jgi:DNA-3-methyladenine glycosylase
MEWMDLPAARVTAAAKALLGWRITANGVTIRLTEVEAYRGADDAASHAFRGRTPRNEIMFGPAGHLYVYFTYGMHWCLNVVAGEEGVAAAVLLRAGEVVDGLDVARTRRPRVPLDRDLARGPARLAMTLGLDGAANGLDLLDNHSPVRLEPRTGRVGRIEAGPRVGVSSEKERPWRFWLADDATVSQYRAHVPKRRGSSAA